MRIVPRSEWAGDLRPRGTPSRIATPTPRLWLHHGASGSSTVATARAYIRWHINNNGWLDGGYSFIIAAGQVLELRGAGRQGAHTGGDNSGSHGICLAGDYSSRTPASRDVDALVWLVAHGAARGWWASPRFTGGHRDSPGGKRTRTTCPGGALHRRIPTINAAAATLAAEPNGDTMSWRDVARRFVIDRGISDGSRPDDPTTRVESWAMMRAYDVGIDGDFLRRQKEELDDLAKVDRATDGSALRHLVVDLRRRR